MRKPRYTTNLFTNFVFNSSLDHLVMWNLTKNLPAGSKERRTLSLNSPLSPSKRAANSPSALSITAFISSLHGGWHIPHGTYPCARASAELEKVTRFAGLIFFGRAAARIVILVRFRGSYERPLGRCGDCARSSRRGGQDND